jgi:formate dehydrogenase subunit gamma
MSGSVNRVDRFDEGARAPVIRHRTIVRAGEILRHPAYTRLLHWSVAAFFVLALLSGFAIYTPLLFHLLTPLFGGGPMTRLLHPWFSLGFVGLFALQFVNWRQPMSWTDDDNRWIRRVREYVTNTGAHEPEYVDFFNAGQKVYFWTITVSAITFIISGLAMWMPRTFGPTTVAIGYVLHDVAAIIMLVGFIVHVYEGTAVAPGTFRSMVRGTVDRRWARAHHPAWYRREVESDANNGRHVGTGNGGHGGNR